MNNPVSRLEINRLILNQKSILQAIPDPVFIFGKKRAPEFMNPAAADFLEHLKKIDTNTGQSSLGTMEPIISSMLRDKDKRGKTSTQLISFHGLKLHLVLAPFAGYSGEKLQWLIIRNLSDTSDWSTPSLKEKGVDRESGATKERTKLFKKSVHPTTSDIRIIGSSKIMKDSLDLAARVAQWDTTVLITGESGTGKELIANLVQEQSKRSDKPFLRINCSTINDTLLESELFGYEQGAFTDAGSTMQGKFEVVNGGTLFLDEIGEISPRMQAALLRVLQNGEIYRVGGNKPIKVDVRIIGATNTNLSDAVKKDTFRLDLFYRLNVINIGVPPLRERKEDIELLFPHFISKYSRLFRKNIEEYSSQIIDRLCNHDWPGNVRELENIIQRAVLLARDGRITDRDIIFDPNSQESISFTYTRKDGNGESLKSMLAEVEKQILITTLQKNNGDVLVTARELQVGKTSLYDKLKSLGISARNYR